MADVPSADLFTRDDVLDAVAALRAGVERGERARAACHADLDRLRAGWRPGQEAIIGTVLGGRDCVGVMPTGAGKSITFQIPARLLGGTALVISPLIALMKDQGVLGRLCHPGKRIMAQRPWSGHLR